MTPLRLAAPRPLSLSPFRCALVALGAIVGSTLTGCGEGQLLEPPAPPPAGVTTARPAAALAAATEGYAVYSDRAAFTGTGTVVFTNGFEEFVGNSMYFPPNPWTAKGVTYTSGGNLILGPDFGSGIRSNVILYDSYTPMTGRLEASSAFTMFGVDLSTLERRDPIDVVITTNLGSYEFPDLNVPLAEEGRIFFGIVLTRSGEYLTGFSFASEGLGSAPLLANVTVGHAVPITNIPPVASAGGPYSGTEGAEVTFAFAAADADGDALTYTWDLGDGTTGTGPTPPASHVYAENGSYAVSLGVSDGKGGSDIRTAAATIANASPEVAAFSVPTTLLALGATGASIDIRTTFTDPGTQDVHTAILDCGGGTVSGTTAGAGALSNASAGGTCTYVEPGVYLVQLTVHDDDGGTDTETGAGQIVVYDPTAGTVTGGGWIASPAGAYPSTPSLTGKLTFGFVAKYRRGETAPEGNAEFKLRFAGLDFRSTAFDWLLIAGTRARCEGFGTLNGSGTYRFAVTAVDDDTAGDQVRIRIWNPVTGNVVYDNLAGAPPESPTAAALGGGSIRIHTR